MTERSKCPNGCVDGMVVPKLNAAITSGLLSGDPYRCPWPGHKPSSECPECGGNGEILTGYGEMEQLEQCQHPSHSHKPTDAPRSAGVRRYTFHDVVNHPEVGPIWVLATDYDQLAADNASLRASLVEFKGDYGKLVDLEGEAQIKVKALEAERDGLAEDVELHRKRAYTLGVAYLDEVMDDEAPRPSKQYTFEETVLIARAAVAALHPTSEAEL